uniref:Uncharacterized protein n=1 Tax=Rhizophora mucronata TaxID=61149 RepID=A0A2P2Q783_RHIMU
MFRARRNQQYYESLTSGMRGLYRSMLT